MTEEEGKNQREIEDFTKPSAQWNKGCLLTTVSNNFFIFFFFMYSNLYVFGALHVLG